MDFRKLAVYFFIVISFSACGGGVKYINHESRNAMIEECLVLKSNKKFKYYKKWDLGQINGEGIWSRSQDTLFLQTEHKFEDLFEIKYEDNSNENSTIILVKNGNYPISYVSANITCTNGKSIVLEANEDGILEINSDIISIDFYSNPLLFSRKVCIPIDAEKGEKVIIDFPSLETDFFLINEVFVDNGDMLYPISNEPCSYFKTSLKAYFSKAK